jgi:hypothetical protein
MKATPNTSIVSIVAVGRRQADPRKYRGELSRPPISLNAILASAVMTRARGELSVALRDLFLIE